MLYQDFFVENTVDNEDSTRTPENNPILSEDLTRNQSSILTLRHPEPALFYFPLYCGREGEGSAPPLFSFFSRVILTSCA
jgi:hypothetical protein